jgi:hypothetical protein
MAEVYRSDPTKRLSDLLNNVNKLPERVKDESQRMLFTVWYLGVTGAFKAAKLGWLVESDGLALSNHFNGLEELPISPLANTKTKATRGSTGSGSVSSPEPVREPNFGEPASLSLEEKIGISSIAYNFLIQRVEPLIFNEMSNLHVQGDVYGFLKVLNMKYSPESATSVFNALNNLITAKQNTGESASVFINRCKKFFDQASNRINKLSPAEILNLMLTVSIYNGLQPNYQEEIRKDIFDDRVVYSKVASEAILKTLTTYEELKGINKSSDLSRSIAIGRPGGNNKRAALKNQQRNGQRDRVYDSNKISERKTIKHCSFCDRRGHSEEECWHKQRRETTSSTYRDSFNRDSTYRDRNTNHDSPAAMDTKARNAPNHTRSSGSDEKKRYNNNTKREYTSSFIHKGNKLFQNKALSAQSVHNSNSSQVTFILDSGSTSHTCSERSIFTELEEREPTEFMVANGEIVKITQYGTIKIEGFSTKDGQEFALTLTDVAYFPQTGANLISLPKLIKSGHRINFQPDLAQINLAARNQDYIDVPEVDGLWCLTINRNQSHNVALQVTTRSQASKGHESRQGNRDSYRDSSYRDSSSPNRDNSNRDSSAPARSKRKSSIKPKTIGKGSNSPKAKSISFSIPPPEDSDEEKSNVSDARSELSEGDLSDF